MARDFSARRHAILVVDPTADGADVLTTRLSADAGYQVETASGAFACATHLANGTKAPDAILLASLLPDADGAEFCARLRQRDITVPILLVGRLASEAQVVRALDLGANDVIQCPLRPAEALARLRAQIRAYEASEDAVLTVGPYQFRPARRQLLNTGTGGRILLTEKEAAVLKFLYRATAPVPRSTLLHEVWGYKAGASTHTVETHIYRLRRKIEPDCGHIGLLVNEDGGYRLRLDRPGEGTSWPAKMTPAKGQGPIVWEHARMMVA